MRAAVNGFVMNLSPPITVKLQRTKSESITRAEAVLDEFRPRSVHARDRQSDFRLWGHPSNDTWLRRPAQFQISTQRLRLLLGANMGPPTGRSVLFKEI